MSVVIAQAAPIEATVEQGTLVGSTTDCIATFKAIAKTNLLDANMKVIDKMMAQRSQTAVGGN